jgi:hypothetical protein
LDIPTANELSAWADATEKVEEDGYQSVDLSTFRNLACAKAGWNPVSSEKTTTQESRLP